MATTSMSTTGSRARLQCPFRSSALAQYYSVQWKKGFVVVAGLINSITPTNMDSRYSIDPTDFSLLIENVQLNDTSANYKCEVFVTDPLSLNGQTRIRLETNPAVLISLEVKGKLKLS